MTNNAVLWDRDARGVATVTLNRPQVNNAYNAEFVEGVLGALDALGGEAGLRAVVIRGAGRHFQAGADLEWLRAVSGRPHADNVAASRATADVVHRLNTLPVPTVALVQGACFGGGTGIIAACDVVIAADNAFFSIAEARWGLIASIIIPQLNDAIGARQVRRYALTGERFTAEDARRIGLVHEVVPLAELDAAGARVTDHLLQNAPEAIAQTKAVALAYAWGKLSGQNFSRLVEQHALKRQSAEAAEGFASFREKRAARWHSRSK
jgi:methylglutaconyl-CoA hydratase